MTLKDLASLNSYRIKVSEARNYFDNEFDKSGTKTVLESQTPLLIEFKKVSYYS